jgi:AcrR family transcriptional regulator
MRRVSPRARRDPEKTREELLEAAFNEIYRNGYQGASLDSILAESGITKGSLYYHFGSKQGLGYAVVEERVKSLVRERYIRPFRTTKDPAEALRKMGLRMERELLKTGILSKGCPVNNLVQEMSGVDEGFRRRLAAILDEWKDTIAEGLRQGQDRGLIRAEVDAEAVATFVVATYQGACGFAKNAQDIEPFKACRRSVDAHIATLRSDSSIQASKN